MLCISSLNGLYLEYPVTSFHPLPSIMLICNSFKIGINEPDSLNEINQLHNLRN